MRSFSSIVMVASPLPNVTVPSSSRRITTLSTSEFIEMFWTEPFIRVTVITAHAASTPLLLGFDEICPAGEALDLIRPRFREIAVMMSHVSEDEITEGTGVHVECGISYPLYLEGVPLVTESSREAVVMIDRERQLRQLARLNSTGSHQ